MTRIEVFAAACVDAASREYGRQWGPAAAWEMADKLEAEARRRDVERMKARREHRYCVYCQYIHTGQFPKDKKGVPHCPECGSDMTSSQ
jgi:hypothetical protein